MKNYKYCFMFGIFLFNIASQFGLQAQSIFQKTYGGSKTEYAYSVKQTSDKGFIIAGVTGSYTDSLGDFYLVKTDLLGSKLWSKTYGTSGVEWGYSVNKTNDHGFIMVGSSDLYNNENSDVYLLKTDSIGNLLWSKTYGGPNADIGYSVQQTSDGGYIVAGVTNSYGAGQNDIYLVKTDSWGNILWTKTFGGTVDDYCQSVQQTSDGGFVLTGNSSSFGVGSGDIILIKTDGAGNIQWTKLYGSTGSEVGFSTQQTTDGGYIIAGISQGFATFHTNSYIIKVDTSGNLVWSKTFDAGGSENLFSVQQTVDFGYVIGGTLESNIDSDIGLIKIDNNGNLTWSKSYGSTNFEDCRSIQQTEDKGYIIAGHSESFGMGEWDVYLIKTDSSGNSGCYQNNLSITVADPPTQVSTASLVVSSGGDMGSPTTFTGMGGTTNTVCAGTAVPNLISNKSFIISPNPSNGIFSIESSSKIKVVSVYDLIGNVIWKQDIEDQKYDVDLRSYPPGVYFIETYIQDSKAINKLIIY